MAEPQSAMLDQTRPAIGRARLSLLKRLADVVCLPSSRVNGFERAMTGDLLVEMLRDAAVSERLRVSKRLASLTDIPNPLLRLLTRDEPEVARPLLEDCVSLSDCDLIDCVRYATVEHRRLIAKRRDLHETVTEALAEGREPIVVETLLRNELASLSPAATCPGASTR